MYTLPVLFVLLHTAGHCHCWEPDMSSQYVFESKAECEAALGNKSPEFVRCLPYRSMSGDPGP